MPEQTTVDIFRSILDLGSTGILLTVLYLFVQGKLFTEKMLEKSMQVLSTNFEKAMRQAVKDGIMEAMVQLDKENK